MSSLHVAPLLPCIDLDDVPLSDRLPIVGSSVEVFETLDDVPLQSRLSILQPQKLRSKKRRKQVSQLHKLKQFIISSDPLLLPLLSRLRDHYRCPNEQLISFTARVSSVHSVEVRCASYAARFGQSLHRSPPSCGGLNKQCSSCLRRFLVNSYFPHRDLSQASTSRGMPLASVCEVTTKRFMPLATDSTVRVYIPTSPASFLSPSGVWSVGAILVFVGYADDGLAERMNEKAGRELYSVWNATSGLRTPIVLCNVVGVMRTFVGLKFAILCDADLYRQRYFRVFSRDPPYTYSQLRKQLSHVWIIDTDVRVLSLVSAVSMMTFVPDCSA